MPPDAWPLIPDVANLTRHLNKQLAGNDRYTVLLKELAKAEKNAENIEDILSFLRSLLLVSKGGAVRGLSETNLRELELAICKEIVGELDVQLPDTHTPYHQLCNWIGSIDRKVAIEIFTTNYDLLMEQALEDSKRPYFDGFVGSRRPFFDLRAVEDNLIPLHWSRLWKIHGSINWYQEELANQKHVFRSSEVRKDSCHLIYPSHLKYEESRKMPYLALIDQLNRFVRKKSSLLVLCGYSFNDEHINDTIINALIANPTAMVLGLMFGRYHKKEATGKLIEQYPEAYRRAKGRHNLNIWTYDKAVIGTKLGVWKNAPSRETQDPDLLTFVSSEATDEPLGSTEDLVKLGDFSVFTNFLTKIIGSPMEEKHV